VHPVQSLRDIIIIILLLINTTGKEYGAIMKAKDNLNKIPDKQSKKGRICLHQVQDCWHHARQYSWRIVSVHYIKTNNYVRENP